MDPVKQEIGVVTLGHQPWRAELRHLLDLSMPRFLLGYGEWTCGRNALADLVIENEGISRQHTRFVVNEREVLVQDLGSLNGTFVNGLRLKGLQKLENKATLGIGSAEFVVHTFEKEEDAEQAQTTKGALGFARLRVPGRERIELPLEQGTYFVGRIPKCEILVESTAVSREHAKLEVGLDGIVVHDLKSSNGTYHEGSLIRKPTRVPWASFVVLGDSRLEFHKSLPRQTLNVPAVDTSAFEPNTVRVLALASLPEELVSGSLLSFFSVAQQQELLRDARNVTLEPNQHLVKAGELADHFNLVVDGELELSGGLSGDGKGSVVSAFQSVELSAVINREKYLQDATARDKVTVLRLSGDALRQILTENPSLKSFLLRMNRYSSAKRLRNLALQYGIEVAATKELVLLLCERRLSVDEMLCQEGECSKGLFLVEQGDFRIVKHLDGKPVEIGHAGPGDLVCAAEALGGTPCMASYQATFNSVVLEIERKALVQVAEGSSGLVQLLTAFGLLSSPTAPLEASGPEQPAEEDEDLPVELFLKSETKPDSHRGRIPFVQQHDEMDCAAACMAMVAKTYGRNIGLATYRSLIHVTREGASMWSIVQAARTTGIQAMGAQLEYDALSEIHWPAILLTEYHFVVLASADEKQVRIVDPGAGSRTLSREEFERQWSGTALLFRPTPALYGYPETKARYHKYLEIMRGNWIHTGELLLASLLLFGFGLVTPLLSQAVFDKVLVEKDISLLGVMVLATVAVSISQILTTAVRQYLTGFLTNRLDTAFSALLYKHVMKLPLAFFAVRRVGDILTRFGETRKVREFLTGETLSTAIDLLSLFIYGAVLFAYHVQLGFLLVAMMPILVATSILLSKSLRRGYNEYFEHTAKTHGLVVEQFRALETIKSMGAEIPARWRWEAAMRKLLKTRFSLENLRAVLDSIGGGVEEIGLVVILYVSARLAMSGELSVGQVVAAGQLAAMAMAPVSALAQRWALLQQTSVAVDRIDDVITIAPEVGAHLLSNEKRPLRGNIDFQDVWFRYGGDLSQWVLKGLTFSIRAGETVAIVGRSGCGKSTLVQMINRLYQPERGRIVIDGRDTAEIPLAELRGSVGMVMQDSHLFCGTILENITYGDDSANMDLAVAAAKVANAHEFIRRQKIGYLTELNEGGGGLSGGQKQRMSIARALYRKPSILVLDEATSSLDAETERGVVEAMRSFCRDRTSIIIAHRLSTVLRAHRILFLEDGRLVEQGTHKELLARQGPYASLFGAQLNM